MSGTHRGAVGSDLNRAAGFALFCGGLARTRPDPGIRSGGLADAAAPLLLWVHEGFVRLRTPAARSVVPAGFAAWIPERLELEPCGEAEALSFSAARSRRFPRGVKVIRPSPLLAELLRHVRNGGGTPAAIDLLCELLVDSPAAPLALPEPQSARARRVAGILADNPGERIPLVELARYASASARTLERLFGEETGWTFERWRQQLRLLVALERLAAGASVSDAALEAGYDSVSAFIAVFRRLTGYTPRRFLDCGR